MLKIFIGPVPGLDDATTTDIDCEYFKALKLHSAHCQSRQETFWPKRAGFIAFNFKECRRRLSILFMSRLHTKSLKVFRNHLEAFLKKEQFLLSWELLDCIQAFVILAIKILYFL